MSSRLMPRKAGSGENCILRYAKWPDKHIHHYANLPIYQYAKKGITCIPLLPELSAMK